MEKKKKINKPWENPGSVRGQFSSDIYEVEAAFLNTDGVHMGIKN